MQHLLMTLSGRVHFFVLHTFARHAGHAQLQRARRYIDDVRRGRGQSGKQYSARYICSLVADFHRRARAGR